MTTGTPSALGIDGLLNLQLQNNFIVRLLDKIQEINISFSDPITTTFYKAISLSFLIFITMMIKNLLNDTSILTSVKNYLYWLFVDGLRNVFYTRYTLVLNNSQKYTTITYKGIKIRDYVLHRTFQDKIFKIEIVSFLDKSKYFSDGKPINQTKYYKKFPIYYYPTENRISDNYEVNYEFLRWWHWSAIKECLEFAYDYEIKNNASTSDSNQKTIKIAYEDQDSDMILYNNIIPDQVYENRNLVQIREILSKHKNITTKLNMFHPLILLVNGKPGLGKTRIADYLINKSLCDNMYVYDMTKFKTWEIKSICNQIKTETSKMIGYNVIMIDEIDKYIDYYINDTYEKEKEKKIKDITSIPDIRLNISLEDIMKSKDQYEKMIKSYILFELLNLIDSRSNGTRRIFIFCANNFLSIFEKIDMRHFDSLYDRFINIEFNPINKEELIEIFKFYSRELGQNEDNTLATDQISDDFQITMRSLHHLFTKNGYNIIKTIEQCK